MTAIESACDSLCGDLCVCTLGVELDKLIIDCSSVLAAYPDIEISQLQEIQCQRAQSCYALHCICFKKVGLVLKCKRHRQAKNQYNPLVIETSSQMLAKISVT